MAYVYLQVAAQKQTLKNVTDYIVDIIRKRAELGYNYGVILIPEGLIDFIPEVCFPEVKYTCSQITCGFFMNFILLYLQVQQLIAELNEILAHEVVDEGGQWKKNLTNQSLQLFEFLPQAIQQQLMLERDPHGNVQAHTLYCCSFI